MKDKKFKEAVKQLEAEGKMIIKKDAKRALTVQILNEHMLTGAIGDENSCVVGQALADALPTAVAVSVGVYVIKILFVDGLILSYRTPPNMREAIRNFDKMGRWDLVAGFYTLGALTRVKVEYTRKRKNKKSGPRGHKGRPLPTRQISIIDQANPKVKRGRPKKVVEV